MNRPEAAQIREVDTALQQKSFRFSSSIVPDLICILDVLAIAVASAAAYWKYISFNPVVLEYYIFCTVFVAITFVFMLYRSGMYEIDAMMRPIGKSDLVIVSLISAFLFFLTIVFSLKVADIYSRSWLYAFFVVALVLVISVRLLAARLLRWLFANRVIGRSLVVLGSGAQAQRFLHHSMRVKPYFTEIVGVFSLDKSGAPGEIEGYRLLGDVSDLLCYARAHKVTDVVIAMPWHADKQVSTTLEDLRELPINVYLSTDLVGYGLHFKPSFGQFSELPVFEVVQRPISGWSFLFKALEDYVIASALLLLLSPLLVLIAIAVKLDSRGPVFFMQKRLGFNNQVFSIFKFRSMYHFEVPETQIRQAERDDPRITRVGRFIRRTSLDELPQLLNVLNGTMSLVGPRPHALRHNEDFGRQIRGYFARHKVKPGITGWAQINGLRGETETLSKMEARVACDVYYAENWSLLFDLRILIMTGIVVFFQKTAY